MHRNTTDFAAVADPIRGVVTSINIGRAERLVQPGFRGLTGILKRPIAGAVRIARDGLEQDAVLNRKHHGGPDQAVYIYRQEDYDWWTAELGHALAPGTFGENLTVSGLPEPGLPIGTRLAFATVVLEISAPRIPCRTLATRMGDPDFSARFVTAARPGFYARVLASGSLTTGAGFQLTYPTGAAAAAADQSAGWQGVNTLEIFAANYRRPGPDELRRFLAAPLDQRTRTRLQKALDRHPRS